MGNYHEQFRGGLGAAMRPGYPTVVASTGRVDGTPVAQSSAPPVLKS
jgi:hypothetical protein